MTVGSEFEFLHVRNQSDYVFLFFFYLNKVIAGVCSPFRSVKSPILFLALVVRGDGHHRHCGARRAPGCLRGQAAAQGDALWVRRFICPPCGWKGGTRRLGQNQKCSHSSQTRLRVFSQSHLCATLPALLTHLPD